MKKTLFALILVVIAFVGLVEFGKWQGVKTEMVLYQVSVIPTKFSLIKSPLPEFELSTPPVVAVSYQKPAQRSSIKAVREVLPVKVVTKPDIHTEPAIIVDSATNFPVPTDAVTNAVSPELWLQIEQQVAENEFSISNFVDDRQSPQADSLTDEAVEFGNVSEDEFTIVETAFIEKVE